MSLKKRAFHTLLAVTLAVPLPSMFLGVQAAHAEGPSDPAPFINAKVVNENAGKKVLFDNTHGHTAGQADWVIDGGFSDFGNGLANAGYYVKELRKSTPLTLADLQGYDVFVTAEAQFPYKPDEQQAMLDYVKGGGSIFFIADHYNADRNKNRWDGSEVYNGYRRGAWSNPAKGMSAEEAASSAMQGVQSSDWLGQNFGVRFRYNALGDITANNIVAPDQAFGITNGVTGVAMHAGSTVAILDPTKAKGIVYLPKTSAKWASAVDQGVYNGGGVAEGAYSAVAKVGAGKAAFIGDSSPVEDASPKYKKEEDGGTKTTHDGWKEVDDAKFLVNVVNWLSKKESYTSLTQVPGLQLDQPTPLLAMETPANSTEPQAEPWASPSASFKWWDPKTYKTGSYGAGGSVVVDPGPGPVTPPASTTYSTVHQSVLPNAQNFLVRVVADNLTPNTTVTGFNAGIYLSGGTQVGLFQNADGTWPTTYGYSSSFSLTADSLGHATKELTVKVKPGTTGAASLRIRQNSNNLKTEAVTIGNVAAEPLPADKPPVPAKISISDARTKSEGTLVTVEGVVTTAPGSFGGQAFYLQDANSGIYVFQSTAGYNVGDKVAVSATLALYNTELELTNPVLIEKTGTAAVPAPVTVTELNNDNQGELVTLEKVTIQNLIAASPTGSFEFDAVNANGSTHVRVDGRTGLTQEAFPYKEGQSVNISGVSAIFKGVFQLKPRGLADFQVNDTSAPVTTVLTSGTPKESGWYNEDVVVSLTATDDSAVDHIEYALSEGAWQTYSAPITISTEGKNSLYVRSVDVNGNVEATQIYVIDIDKTAPTADVQAEQAANDNGWYNQEVKLQLSAADGQSQIGRIEYSLNGGEWQKVYSAAQAIYVDTEGATTVDVRSFDFADNVSEIKSITVQLDRTAPSVSGSSVGENANGWYKQDFNFAVSATDETSGVASVEVKLNDGEWTVYTAPVAVTNEGVNVVQYRATDKAGNVSAVETSLVHLDKTAPVTQASLLNGAQESGWNHNDVTFEVTATDAVSSVGSIEVKINDADWALYTEPVTVSAEGKTTILYRATDKAGNIADAKSITVQLDKNAPVLKLTQDGGAVHDVFADGKLSFNLSATDAVSGVVQQLLTLDGNAITSGSALDAAALALGEHTVRAMAIDQAGNVAQVSFTFKVNTSLATVQNLLQKFAANGEVKNQGIQSSLEAKLNTAKKFVESGKPEQAAKHLQDLQSTLTTYAGTGNVSKAAASVLNSNLQYLLTNGIK